MLCKLSNIICIDPHKSIGLICHYCSAKFSKKVAEKNFVCASDNEANFRCAKAKAKVKIKGESTWKCVKINLLFARHHFLKFSTHLSNSSLSYHSIPSIFDVFFCPCVNDFSDNLTNFIRHLCSIFK